MRTLFSILTVCLALTFFGCANLNLCMGPDGRMVVCAPDAQDNPDAAQAPDAMPPQEEVAQAPDTATTTDADAGSSDASSAPEGSVVPPDTGPDCPNQCNDGNPMTLDRCTSMGCTHTPTATSCLGCWQSPGTAGQMCLPGDQLTSCGGNGTVCTSCNDNNPCTFDHCDAHACVHNAATMQWTDCQPLTGTSGQCTSGTCTPCGDLNGPCCRLPGRTPCQTGAACGADFLCH